MRYCTAGNGEERPCQTVSGNVRKCERGDYRGGEK